MILASIQTGIELNDRFTSVIMGIINSVNYAVSSMEIMNQTLQADIDTTSMEETRQQINEATVAANELSQAFMNMAAPDVSQPSGMSKREPVRQPVEWQSYGVDVFSSSGMERFTQEIESANTMLTKLSATQNEIARKAAIANILPPKAINDMTSMAVRVDNLKTRIHQLEENPINLGTDAANAELEQTRKLLDQANQAQDAMNMAIREMDVSAANVAYMRLSGIIGNTEQYIRDNANEQESFNAKIEQGTPKARSFVKALMGLSVVQSAIGMVKGQIDSAIGRMDTMTNYNRTMTAITGNSEMAAASLNQLKDITSGTAYGLDVAASSVQNFVTRGIDVGNAVNEVKSWADAVSFYGDGTNETLHTVTDALGKMLTKGTVEMEQLNRLTDAGINAVGMYAQATGRAAADVQSDLSYGRISSQDFITTVSSAFENGTNGVLNISGAAKEAGATWATSIANAKAAVTRGVIDMIDGINQGLSDAGFGTILDGIKGFGVQAENVLSRIGSFAGQVISMASPLINIVVGTFTYIADNANITLDSVMNGMGNFAGVVISILVPIFSLISNIAMFVVDNWGMISPIVYGIVAALGAYYVIMGIIRAIEVISTGVKIALAVASFAHAAATGTQASATAFATAAQYGLNTAMLACPLTWIIILIVALIGVVILLANHFSGAGHVAQSAFGAICGAASVAMAVLLNIVIGVVNGILQIVWAAAEPFIGIIEWVLNAANGGFNSFGDAVANLIGQIISWFLSLGKVVTRIIDAIFGTDWTAGLSSLQNTVLAWGKNDNAITIDRNSVGIDYRFNYGDAYKSGAQWGDGVSDKIKNKFSRKQDDVPNPSDYSSALAISNAPAIDTAENTGKTASNTAKAADSLSATSEDLKYIRDMAETDYINRFTTANITVNQTNNNTINNDMDLDGVTEHLRTTVEEQMDAAAEGAH